MKWYVLTFFLLVGFVWNASAQPAQPAQPIDPKLVGEWETTDGPCDPCTLSIQAGKLPIPWRTLRLKFFMPEEPQTLA